MSVADDIGSDFFCTIFEIQDVSGRDALMPRSSFAIQVKSSASEVSADNKIEYLMRLEMPFFLGVVSQSLPEMKIYSAEFLSLLFAEFGQPNKLSLIPIDGSAFDPNRYHELKGPEEVHLYCPLVATFGVGDDRSTLAPKVDALLGICTRARGNIATRVSEEHIYDVNGGGNLRIVAGSGSFRFFRSNFLKRLGEVFQNLVWLLGASPSNFPMKEFETFESLYNSLESLYGQLPNYVSEPYRSLKAKLTGQSV